MDIAALNSTIAADSARDSPLILTWFRVVVVRVIVSITGRNQGGNGIMIAVPWGTGSTGRAHHGCEAMLL
jgi:hypothetical protein